MIQSISKRWTDARPYIGALGEPIPLGRDPRKALTTMVERWEALYHHYGIDPAEPDAKDRLLLSLARAHVPGFQFKEDETRGRRRTSSGELVDLIHDVESLKAKGKSTKRACDLLAEHYERYRGLSGDAIRSRYYAATRYHNKVNVDAYMTHRRERKLLKNSAG